MQFTIFDDAEAIALSADEAPDYRTERNLARAAEYLAAFDISRRGFDCFMAGEGLRYDLIADVGGLRRVQVKMCRRATYRASGSVSLSYTFGGSDKHLSAYVGDIDLFAFVAMDRQTVLYMPPHQLKRQKLHVPASTVSPETSDLSWADMMRGWGVE